MSSNIVDKQLSSKVIMAGNYFKNHHPGGISAVIQYWNDYIEDLQYYPTYKLSNIFVRICFFVTSYARIFVRLLLDNDIQIVHLHTAADGSFWRKAQLVKLGRLFNKRIILHIHASRFKDFYNESSEKKKVWIRDTLSVVDVLIVLSNSWKEWFIQIGIPQDRVVVLHNITPHPRIMSESHVNDGKIHYLFLGEIGTRKGIFDVMQVVIDHKADFQGKIEIRIGGNRNEGTLLSMISDNGLEDIVKFDGWVSGINKQKLLNWADVFILPSYNEGLPISILEAMSYKHPIISTPVGGIPEVLETDVNGVLVSPGNCDEIFSAMKKYVDNPQLIDSEGCESLKRVEQYYPDYVLNQLRTIYESII